MNREDLLRRLEGLHNVETVAEALKIKKQSAINLLSKLKRKGYVTVSKHKRSLYKISMRKQRQRDPGMFDIINKYNKNMKLMPWYDHQVHGAYGPEDALIDAIQTESFRVILASMRLFSHINNWPKLYKLAKEKGIWQKVGALYDLSKRFFRVTKIPKIYPQHDGIRWSKLTQLKKMNFPTIAKKWHVYIPFNEYDMEEIA